MTSGGFSVERCERASCDMRQMHGCGYQDRDGRKCPTRWCMVHVTVVNGVGYCPRHAGVMRAIRGSSSPQERPPVTCRAPSLANWIADSMGPEITETVAGFGIEVEAHALEHHLEGRQHRWERAWSLQSNEGTLPILIDVAEHTDIVVRIRLGEKTLLRAVPPWIEQHQIGAFDDAEELRIRNQFCMRIVFMITQALEVGQRSSATFLGTPAEQQPI